MSPPGNTERHRQDSHDAALRAFLGRLLGWSNASAIGHALRTLHLSTTRSAALVILGEGDLVPIAQALHRRTLGDGRPFVLCDRRRRPNLRANVRSPTNYTSGVTAVEKARGGSLCVNHARLPRDFAALVALVRANADAQVVVCAELHLGLHPFVIRPTPIEVPSLRTRANELARIVEEYGREAVAELSASSADFTSRDRDWILEHSASTLPDIEKGARRLVALRRGGSVNRAAALLGMSRMALSQWYRRRRGRVARRGRPSS